MLGLRNREFGSQGGEFVWEIKKEGLRVVLIE